MCKLIFQMDQTLRIICYIWILIKQQYKELNNQVDKKMTHFVSARPFLPVTPALVNRFLNYMAAVTRLKIRYYAKKWTFQYKVYLTLFL